MGASVCVQIPGPAFGKLSDGTGDARNRNFLELRRRAVGAQLSAAVEEIDEFALGPGGERFGSEFAVPAMSVQGGEEFGRKGPFIAGGEVGVYVAGFAHAGNGSGDVGIGEDEAEGQVGKCEPVAEKRLQRINTIKRVAKIFG